MLPDAPFFTISFNPFVVRAKRGTVTTVVAGATSSVHGLS